MFGLLVVYPDAKREASESALIFGSCPFLLACLLAYPTLQIAAAAGATVIATSSSDSKLEIARSLGATHLINYRTTQDWSSEVLKLTNGAGVDVVFDVVGGADLDHSIKSARYGGRIALAGILDKEDAPISPTKGLLYGAKTSKLDASVLCKVLYLSSMLDPSADLYLLFQSKPSSAPVAATWRPICLLSWKSTRSTRRLRRRSSLKKPIKLSRR